MREEKIVDARLSDKSTNPLGLLLMDIDRFKSFNDTYGHTMGDEILKRVGEWIKSATRGNDFAARYGGEEFVVLIQNSSLPVLNNVAKRLRKIIREKNVEYNGQNLSVTVSVGGAILEKVTGPEDGIKLLMLADDCLYKAKNAGGDTFFFQEMT